MSVNVWLYDLLCPVTRNTKDLLQNLWLQKLNFITIRTTIHKICYFFKIHSKSQNSTIYIDRIIWKTFISEYADASLSEYGDSVYMQSKMGNGTTVKLSAKVKWPNQSHFESSFWIVHVSPSLRTDRKSSFFSLDEEINVD